MASRLERLATQAKTSQLQSIEKTTTLDGQERLSARGFQLYLWQQVQHTGTSFSKFRNRCPTAVKSSNTSIKAEQTDLRYKKTSYSELICFCREWISFCCERVCFCCERICFWRAVERFAFAVSDLLLPWVICFALTVVGHRSIQCVELISRQVHCSFLCKLGERRVCLVPRMCNGHSVLHYIRGSEKLRSCPRYFLLGLKRDAILVLYFQKMKVWLFPLFFLFLLQTSYAVCWCTLDCLSFLCDRCKLYLRDPSAFQLAYSWKYLSFYRFKITQMKGKMFGGFVWRVSRRNRWPLCVICARSFIHVSKF